MEPIVIHPLSIEPDTPWRLAILQVIGWPSTVRRTLGALRRYRDSPPFTHVVHPSREMDPVKVPAAAMGYLRNRGFKEVDPGTRVE